MGLEGRVVVITGSGSGIGRSSALEFAKAGAKVVVADINLDGAQETAQQIVTAGGLALAVETDVSQTASVVIGRRGQALVVPLGKSGDVVQEWWKRKREVVVAR